METYIKYSELNKSKRRSLRNSEKFKLSRRNKNKNFILKLENKRRPPNSKNKRKKKKEEGKQNHFVSRNTVKLQINLNERTNL